MLKTMFFACVATALVAAGTLGTAQPVRAADTSIVVGTAGKETDAEVYYALDMGFFKKQGLNVEIQTLPNGAAVASAVAAGALQIGDSNTLSLATARQKGLPFVIFAPGAVYQSTAPTTAVGVAANGPIKTAKDLTGKVLAGVSLGGLDQLSLHVWLDKSGGDSTAVKFVELGPAQMVAALERGTVAAVSLPDPVLTAALNDGTVRVIGNNYEAIAKTFMITGWFATNDYIAKNPDVIKKYADAMAETAAWANANHDKASEILLKYTKIDAKKSRVRYAGRLNAAIVQPVLDAGAQYKMLDKSVTVTELLSLK
jgi:NitT/TauT family transport system substrate-binding protein